MTPLERLRAKVEAGVWGFVLALITSGLYYPENLIDSEKGAERAGSGTSASADASVLNPASQPPQKKEER